MPSSSDSQNLLEDLIKKAKAAGADAADALMFKSVSVSHAQRLGKMEKLEREESNDLGLRVFIGKRNAVVSSSDASPAAIDELVDRVVSMARVVPEDPYAGIAGEEEITKSFPQLDIYDAVEPSADELIKRAKECEEAALNVKGITNSGGAEASWGEASIALAASNGFSGAYKSSGHSISVSVLAGEKETMERDYDFSSAVYGSDLTSASEIGKNAADKAIKRLNPRKPDTLNDISVVYDPRVSSSIMGHMIGAITGPAIARGTSFPQRLIEQKDLCRWHQYC